PRQSALHRGWAVCRGYDDQYVRESIAHLSRFDPGFRSASWSARKQGCAEGLEATEQNRISEIAMWYSASLLIKRTHPQADPGIGDDLWEESIILIQANSEDEARQEAERLGRTEDLDFQAVSGEMVKW